MPHPAFFPPYLPHFSSMSQGFIPHSGVPDPRNPDPAGSQTIGAVPGISGGPHPPMVSPPAIIPIQTPTSLSLPHSTSDANDNTLNATGTRLFSPYLYKLLMYHDISRCGRLASGISEERSSQGRRAAKVEFYKVGMAFQQCTSSQRV